MEIKGRMEAPLGKALDFLALHQLPHGEFTTLLGSDRSMAVCVPDSACFVTAHVLYALSLTRAPRVRPLIERAAEFLRWEREPGGLWRYWSSRNHKHARLGPDLDDTAVASAALARAGFAVPHNAWAFRRSRDLMGRFYTWVLPTRLTRFDVFGRSLLTLGARSAQAKARRVPTPPFEDPRFLVRRIDMDDVDPVVNANAILHLGERPETEAAVAFVIHIVNDEPARPSLYYDDPLALYHAVARCALISPGLAALGPLIVARMRMRLGAGEALDPLRTALAATVFSAFAPADPLLSLLASSLLESQEADGGWKACAFYNVWGSRELTTAFALEGLIGIGPSAHRS